MLSVQIPKDRKRLERSIAALEWQINQDLNEEDRNIHMQVLEAYKQALAGHMAREVQIHN